MKNVSDIIGKLLKCLVYLVLLGSLASCVKDTLDLEEHFEYHRNIPAKPIEPLLEIQPYLRYFYPGNSRDPFNALMLESDVQ